MDSVNRALDTIIVERFWRSLKYEDIYIKDYRTLAELKLGVSRYIKFYNSAHCLIENLSETIPMPHHKI